MSAAFRRLWATAGRADRVMCSIPLWVVPALVLILRPRRRSGDGSLQVRATTCCRNTRAAKGEPVDGRHAPPCSDWECSRVTWARAVGGVGVGRAWRSCRAAAGAGRGLDLHACVRVPALWFDTSRSQSCRRSVPSRSRRHSSLLHRGTIDAGTADVIDVRALRHHNPPQPAHRVEPRGRSPT